MCGGGAAGSGAQLGRGGVPTGLRAGPQEAAHGHHGWEEGECLGGWVTEARGTNRVSGGLCYGGTGDQQSVWGAGSRRHVGPTEEP